MFKVVGVFIWVSLIAALLAGLHYYLWIRLGRDLALSLYWSEALGIALIVSAFLLPVGMGISRVVSRPWVDQFAFVAYVWMGFVFFLLLSLGVLELPRGIVHTLALWDSNDGVSVARFLAAFSFIGASLVALSALRGASGTPSIKKFTLPMDRLPETMNGTTVVQLSDVHVGPTIKRPRIEALVREVNALDPDLIVITGDLVDGSVADLRDSVAPLANLSSKYGTFFVTGNHEYYSGVDSWVRELESLGIRVLRNECISIGEGAASFDLAGVDDATARFFGNGHGADYDKALANHDSNKALVFLAHQPRQIYKLENADIDLMLTGHTHGGQIWPFGFLVRLVQPYLAGMVQHNGINLYVSRGAGYWGPPMRFKAPAEISHFTLESSAIV